MCFALAGLADAALGEGTGVKLHKLSVREIKAVRCLFTRFITRLVLSKRALLFYF